MTTRPYMTKRTVILLTSISNSLSKISSFNCVLIISAYFPFWALIHFRNITCNIWARDDVAITTFFGSEMVSLADFEILEKSLLSPVRFSKKLPGRVRGAGEQKRPRFMTPRTRIRGVYILSLIHI